ncbi:serine hydrolase [Streptomyces sp. NPDC088915]|uniref:D-alanyl-D-alanine carboxypeptidase family protein n=1 Tax=Streptomyces sp. NPDC088915 TaxID=3365912 RepID=UPI0037F403AB
MTHEGGTVAGESPDRAEQQGPSQETTAAASGGGGRDPRLSVLRESEPSAPSASEEASDAPVRVDQPTAVFKNLTPRTSGDDAPKGDAEPESSEPEEPEAESSPSEPEPESERLKAAVAAWVATAADDEPEEPVKTAEEASEPVEEPAETEEEAPEPAEAGDGADAEPEAGAEAADEDEDEDEAEAEDEVAEEVAAESAGAAGDVEGSEDSEDSDASKASEDDAPAEGKAPADSWFAARKSAAGAKTEAVKDPEPAGDAAGDSEDAGEEPVDEKPVDQPTAMFKMIRPHVDQPTTALKLPAGSVDTDTDTDSERTSTFLPLRPDIPAERKAPAAEAAPTASTAPKDPETPKAPKASETPEAEAPEAPTAPVPAALAEPERTRQQPLPPLPPLDLLAELTNTPPPPPSPLRTTLRRIRIWTPLVLLLLIVFAIAQMVRPLPAPALKLSAAPTFTFEGGELKMPWPGEGQGAVEVEGVGAMGAYGPQKPAPIASVTKTMTAYVILRDHPLKGKQTGPEIKIDKKAADQGKAAHESTAAVEEGQTYSEKELLQLLMIPSANNVARLLARWDAGSEAAFVEKMNAAADELGMTQSTYTDPSGLLDSTVSTPKDQLKLAEAVMQYDVFREIVNMPNVTVDGIPGRIENNNKILLKPGVGGIKTGSSTPAGGNLLWSANTIVDGQNRRILGIVMGAKNAKILDDKLQLSIDYSYELIKRAQKDVTSAAVVRKGQIVGYVDDGLGGKTPVVATKELKAVGWPGLQVKLELADGGKAVPHTGRTGDVVGQVSIGTGAGRVSSPVALQSDLAEPGFDKKLTRVG